MMIVQYDGRAAIIPLRQRNGCYDWEICNIKYQIAACMERYVAYLLYSGLVKQEVQPNGMTQEGEFGAWIRTCLIKDATPMEIDSAKDSFIKHHPIETVYKKYDWEDIPVYADKYYGLALPIPHYTCVISGKMEQELLEELRKANLTPGHFTAIRAKYGLDYSKKLKHTQDAELMISFLEQHGISPAAYERYHDRKHWYEKPMGYILGYGSVIAGATLFCFATEFEYPLLIFTGVILGPVLMTWPFLLARK